MNLVHNENSIGCGCLIIIALIAISVHYCEQNGNSAESEKGKNPLERLEKINPITERYGDNRLETGNQPYENETIVRGDDSQIVVRTSGTDRTDVVVILKKNDMIVRNKYVQAGDQVVFDIPDGTYQVFFYYGKGWYPDKEMPNGMKGGFVMYESFSKDDPQSLEHNILTYELILQTDGNFSARPSNAEEAF